MSDKLLMAAIGLLLGVGLRMVFATPKQRARFFKLEIGTRSLLFGAHQFLIHPWFVAEAWRRLFGFPWDPRLWVLFFVHDLGYLGKPNMDGPEGEQHPRLGARIMGALFDRGVDIETGKWEVVKDAEGDAWRVRWSLPDSEGRYLWVRHYIVGQLSPGWCEAAAERDAAEMNRKCRVPSDHPNGHTAPLSTTRPRSFWHDMALYHSRFLSKQAGKPVSRLCYADKLAICLTPAWLYLPLVRLSGEIHEYMRRSEQKEGQKYDSMVIYSDSQRQWYENMRDYILRWVEEHKDGREDSWTPKQPPGGREAHDDSGVWR